MTMSTVFLIGLAAAFFIWILVGMKKQNAKNKETAAANAAYASAYAAQLAAQHPADLAAWATSIYNPASPTYDAVAFGHAMSQWYGAKNPAFDPTNRNNVNFNPTL